MLANVLDISAEILLDAVSAKIPQGFRFVTITCCDHGAAFDLIYHFDKQYVLHHLRLALAKGTALPSISGVCPAAVFAENEIKDLFGITVTGLAVDYEGKFLLSDKAPKAPLATRGELKIEN